MAIQRRELYQSSNGDRWYLAHDTDSERLFVQHQANAPSGGHIEDFELGSFLNRAKGSPEHRALVLMLAELIKNDVKSDADELMPSSDEFGS